MRRSANAATATSVLFWPESFAQETVTFEDVEYPSRWEESLVLLAFTTLCYVAWVALTSFIEARRSTIPRDKLARRVPTVMVALGWSSPLLAEDGFLFVVMIALNIPGLIVAAPLFWVLDPFPFLLRVFAATAAGWLTWYGVIRWLEWRAWSHVPVTLNLALRDANPPRDQSADSSH